MARWWGVAIAAAVAVAVAVNVAVPLLTETVDRAKRNTERVEQDFRDQGIAVRETECTDDGACTVTLEDGSTRECRVERGGAVVCGTAPAAR